MKGSVVNSNALLVKDPTMSIFSKISGRSHSLAPNALHSPSLTSSIRLDSVI